ncbi:class I SAM-dependent methyltransferase [Myceligenerans pegani]|uniref:Class I SAM-dependent methyltransferase n=1 Tax=Myceligenerans pegani TaxID=2776917 RepID=A0ABR9MZG5_9MICO|nr:methyltransferase [Myceligenerans sp. TRM 65318]MBE1876416.1 class I SAM-dependent methyltransferase [Myceligenerans sp. TRM 65318]MBE3018687.1 class I SAM-dependent methyltransferase [Myceligenerans sp. TRM 65318]
MPQDDVGHHDHYFSERPASATDLRTITVRIAGREAEVDVAAGVFSPGGIDKGTCVLLEEVPAPPGGDLLDLGCGWGPLGLTMAAERPDARVWAVDVNERALDLVRRNAERLGLGNVRAVTPDEVPDDVRFAAVWSNPPIRVGKAVLHELMGRWLPRLAPGGDAWLVVQKNLGADSLARWIADELGLPVSRETSSKGFRVLRVSAA